MGTYAMTGGATGIGAAIKQQLVSEGHSMIVVDVKDADIVADLSTSEGRNSAIEALNAAASSGLDGFIVCAGVGSNVPNKPLIARVNFLGSTELIAGVKDLLAAKSGSVVLVSSNSAPMPTNADYVDQLLAGDEDAACKTTEGMEAQAVYSGSKQAVARWMRRNVVEYAKAGIRMNAIAPGYTQTPMTEAVENDPVYGEAIREFMASIPVGRPGKPQDMASTVSFLMKPEASFICGSVIFVDGGHDAMMRPDQF